MFVLNSVDRRVLDSNGLDVLLSQVLHDLANVLRNYNFQYPIKDIDLNKYSLKFSIRNIKFDLLAAIDFVGNEDNPGKQQQLTLDVIAQDLPKNIYRFSSSLAFATVDFMKKQSSFANEMARLAKFWYKSACIDVHVSGSSYFMELVAIYVVNQMHTHSHRDAFRNFLNQMINFERINIVFDEYGHLTGHRPSNNVPLPCVIDPSNPYNNLGKHFKRMPNVMATLKVHAQHTLQNLQELISNPQLELHHAIDLFDPFLLNTVKIFHVSPKYNERGIRRLKDVDICPQINNGDRKKIEFIQLCLSAVVNKLEERHGPNNLELVIEALVEIMTRKLKAKSSIAANSYAHDEYDASIWLKTEHSGAIRLSFDLDYARNDSGECFEKKKRKYQTYLRRTDAELKAKNVNASVLHCYSIYVV